MQVVHHAEHSSRRQQHRRSTNSNNLNWRPHQANNENSSDVEGTAHRVASVTLNTESDSRTSADAPMSFRSKRRKKLPRREKGQGTTTTVEMEVDEQQSPPWKKQSVSGADGTAAAATVIPTCKLQMDWEHGEGGPSGAVDGTARSISVSDMDNNQSDNQLSFSDSEASASNVDADDEQSDWPGNELAKHQPVAAAVRSSIHQLTPGGPTARHRPTTAPPTAQKDAALSAGMVKRIEHFLRDPEERELLLDQVYRTSAVKQMLRGQPVAVQIVKRGRGTVALKKN